MVVLVIIIKFVASSRVLCLTVFSRFLCEQISADWILLINALQRRALKFSVLVKKILILFACRFVSFVAIMFFVFAVDSFYFFARRVFAPGRIPVWVRCRILDRLIDFLKLTNGAILVQVHLGSVFWFASLARFLFHILVELGFVEIVFLVTQSVALRYILLMVSAINTPIACFGLGGRVWILLLVGTEPGVH